MLRVIEFNILTIKIEKKKFNPDGIWYFYVYPDWLSIWNSNGHEDFWVLVFGLRCTCVSRHWSPISRSMFLDVWHQDDVFFRRPRTLLDTNFITARRPSHDFCKLPPSSPPAFPYDALSLLVPWHVSVYILGERGTFFTVHLPLWLACLFLLLYFFWTVNYTQSKSAE